MKLVKIQREVLQASLEIWENHGKNCKPIMTNKRAARKESGFSKNYERYAIKMEQLIDAGIIARVQPNSDIAYLVNKETVKELLAQ